MFIGVTGAAMALTAPPETCPLPRSLRTECISNIRVLAIQARGGPEGPFVGDLEVTSMTDFTGRRTYPQRSW